MVESIREEDRRLKAQEAAEKKEQEEKKEKDAKGAKEVKEAKEPAKETDEKKKDAKSLSEEERRVEEKAAEKKITKEDAQKEVAQDNIKKKTGYSAESLAEVARTVLETRDSYDHATIGQTTEAMSRVKGNSVEGMLESMAQDPALAKDVVRAGLGSKFTSTNESGVKDGSRTVLEKNREVGGAAGMEEALSQAALYGKGLTAAEIKEMQMNPALLKAKVEELKASAPRIPQGAEKNNVEQKDTPKQTREDNPEQAKAVRDWMAASR